MKKVLFAFVFVTFFAMLACPSGPSTSTAIEDVDSTVVDTPVVDSVFK